MGAYVVFRDQTQVTACNTNALHSGLLLWACNTFWLLFLQTIWNQYPKIFIYYSKFFCLKSGYKLLNSSFSYCIALWESMRQQRYIYIYLFIFQEAIYIAFLIRLLINLVPFCYYRIKFLDPRNHEASQLFRAIYLKVHNINYMFKNSCHVP